MPRIKQLADKYAMADWCAHLAGRMKMDGVTQAKLGDALGVSQQAVSKMLKRPDELSIRELRNVCKIVNIDPAALLKAVGLQNKKGDQI